MALLFSLQMQMQREFDCDVQCARWANKEKKKPFNKHFINVKYTIICWLHNLANQKIFSEFVQSQMIQFVVCTFVVFTLNAFNFKWSCIDQSLFEFIVWMKYMCSSLRLFYADCYIVLILMAIANVFFIIIVYSLFFFYFFSFSSTVWRKNERAHVNIIKCRKIYV